MARGRIAETISERMGSIIGRDRKLLGRENPTPPTGGSAGDSAGGAGGRALERGKDEAAEAAGSGGHYAPLNSPEGVIAGKQANAFISGGGHGQLHSPTSKASEANTTSKRVGDVLDWGRSNYQNAAMSEGRSALGLAGKHAVQGAATGGLAGGTIEASQGGSFWDGAKQGAFNGAVGMTAVRGAKRMSGAKNYFGENGVRKSAGNMWGSTSNSGKVSKQATSLLNQTQRDGMTRSIMNQNAKKAKQV